MRIPHRLVLALLLTSIELSQSQSFSPKRWDMKRAISVANSTSPNGKCALFESYGVHSPTHSGILIASVPKKTPLARVPSLTQWSTDRPHEELLDFRWAPDSKSIATHDKMSKHSKVRIFAQKGEEFSEYPLPDLAVKARLAMDVADDDISSSGQDPVKWIDETTLQIRVRLKLRNGQLKSREYQLKIDHAKSQVTIRDSP